MQMKHLRDWGQTECQCEIWIRSTLFWLISFWTWLKHRVSWWKGFEYFAVFVTSLKEKSIKILFPSIKMLNAYSETKKKWDLQPPISTDRGRKEKKQE